MHFRTLPPPLTWKLATHLSKPRLRWGSKRCFAQAFEKKRFWRIVPESHKNANKIYSFLKRFWNAQALFCVKKAMLLKASAPGFPQLSV